MRHALIVLEVLLLAAACAGGGSTAVDASADPDPDAEVADANASCGDGVVNGTDETCDDGNLTSGDGCSATCLDERCGDGVINDVDETCDDGETPDDGDGCDSDCTVEAGHVCSGEPSTCLVRDGSCAAPFLYAGAMMSGDTTGGGDDVTSGACDGFLVGDAPDHAYELAVSGGDDVVITLDPTFDGIVRLLTSACDDATEVIEPGQPEGCADFNDNTGPEVLRYLNLAAGTYYVIVDGSVDDDEGAYDLSVSLAASTCGNGTIEAFEACDDDGTATGDGCDASCQEEPGYNCGGAEPSVCTVSCGNGEIDDPTEECEDGNPTNGDRCSTACVLESTVTESEPNELATDADVVVAGSIVRGSVDGDDFDVYAFTTTVPVLLELELYTSVDGDETNYDGLGSLDPVVDCDHDIDLYFLDNPDYDPATQLYDDLDGDGNCAYLGPSNAPGMMVQPGTYYIGVLTDEVVPVYILDVKVTPATPVAATHVDQLIINEYLANDSTLDANCDGATTGEQDEFIELLNVGTSFLDLTGVRISDTTNVRHTFGARGLRPGEAMTVFSGGTATCPSFEAGSVEISDAALSFNNTNETITVSTAAATIATVSYVSSTVGISANLTTDAVDVVVGTTCGVFAAHNTVGVVDFSPGTRIDGTAW